MASTIYFEILINPLGDILVRDVLRYDLVRHVSRTAAEVAPRPQVPSPELLLHMWKLQHQVVRVFPFGHCNSRLIVVNVLSRQSSPPGEKGVE